MLKTTEFKNRLQNIVNKELTINNLEEIVLFDKPNAKGKGNIRFDGIHKTSDNSWSKIIMSGSENVRVAVEEREGKIFVKEVI